MAATVRWLGCTTFLFEGDGVRLLLDAYLTRVPGAPALPLDDFEPGRLDAILLGHSHAHHMGDAPRLAREFGVPVYGHATAAAVLREYGVPAPQVVTVAGGERFRFGSVEVRTLPFLHACDWMPPGTADTHQGLDEPARAGLDAGGNRQRELLARDDSAANAMREHLVTTPGTGWHGGAIGYLLEWPGGSLLFQDSAGAWSSVLAGLRPDAAILAAAGVPNLDGDPFRGSIEAFLALEAALLGWPAVIPCHHDNWMPPLTAERSSPLVLPAPAAEHVALANLAYGEPFALPASADGGRAPALSEACPVCRELRTVLYRSTDAAGRHTRVFCQSCAAMPEFRDRLEAGLATLGAIPGLRAWAFGRMLRHASEQEATRER